MTLRHGVTRSRHARLPGLPPLDHSAFEVAVADLRALDGGWLVTNWLEANRDYFSPDGTVWMDKANGANFGGVAAPSFGFDSKSNPKITMNGGHHFNPGDAGQYPSTTLWTLYIVYLDVVTAALNFLMGGHSSLAVGTSGAQEILLSSNAGPTEMDIRFGNGSGNIRRLDTTTEWGGSGPIIFGVDFDADVGMAFRKNGTQTGAATNSTARAPLVDKRWQLGRISSSNSNRWRGSIAEIIICKADLRGAGYAHARSVIEGGLIAKYL